MKRYNTILLNNIPANPETLKKQTAIHEAGHAAAIHLGNKRKKLPPIFFQIVIQGMALEVPCPCRDDATNPPAMTCFARVEGGRLIHTLPASLTEATQCFSPSERQAYHAAFEADIVNFLAGPLAEAKYVADCDNEPFNPRLVNLNALPFYGGAADVALAKDYLDCLMIDKEEKEQKITELFMTAYRFISQRSHWRAITALADFIMDSGKKVIACEEIIRVLDAQATRDVQFSGQIGFSLTKQRGADPDDRRSFEDRGF